MHKYCAVFVVVVLALEHVCAGNLDNEEPPVKFDTSNIANGQYNFQFKTPDLIEREESGGLDSNGNYVVKGYYSYINDLNQRISYTYTADKDGYRAIAKPVLTSPTTYPSATYFGSPPYITAALLG